VSFKRYEFYWANLDPTIGSEINNTRPVVIVSDNMMNKLLDTVVVCPLTTKLHPTWRSRIQVNCAGQPSEIAVDQIRTIAKQRLYKRIDKLDPQTAKQLRQLITTMYGE
jgi:mRNA interferase MazF